MTARLLICLFSGITAGCTIIAAAQPSALANAADLSKHGAVLVTLFQPVYPPLARQARITGEVRVAVTVHRNGTAEVLIESGHPMLKKAALDSAAQSHFECHD